MQNCHKTVDIQFHTDFLILTAFAFVFIPLNFLIAWFAAVLIHELSHLVALKLLGVDFVSIHITALGMQIHTAQLSLQQELICSIAGPLGGFLPLLFIRYVPITAMFALIHSIYNAIPIGERDGGRILRSVLQIKLGHQKGLCYYKQIERFVKIGGLTAGIILALKCQLSITFFLLLLFLFFNRKIPCKAGSQIVQYRQQKPKRYDCYERDLRKNFAYRAKTSPLHRR